jgi:hypothetical protein
MSMRLKGSLIVLSEASRLRASSGVHGKKCYLSKAEYVMSLVVSGDKKTCRWDVTFFDPEPRWIRSAVPATTVSPRHCILQQRLIDRLTWIQE